MTTCVGMIFVPLMTYHIPQHQATLLTIAARNGDAEIVSCLLGYFAMETELGIYINLQGQV